MRVITAYARFIEALEVLGSAATSGMAHVPSDAAALGALRRDVNNLKEHLLTVTPESPNSQIDQITLEAILRIYEAAYRARFLEGSETTFGDFLRAADDCRSGVSALYASSGSESWGRFPPKR